MSRPEAAAQALQTDPGQAAAVPDRDDLRRRTIRGRRAGVGRKEAWKAMQARTLWTALALSLAGLLIGAAAPEPAAAKCCAPPPPPPVCCKPAPPPCCEAPKPPPPPPAPPCCTPGHSVKVPGVSVFVAPTVIVNASASASVNVSASGSGSGAGAGFGAGLGGGGVFVGGGGGGGGYYSPPVATGLIQGLDVVGGRKLRRTAYEATRRKTVRVVIQAVCIDDRATPHPAAQTFPDREVGDDFEGELYRCVAGSRLQVTWVEYAGRVDFSGGKMIACAKGEALWRGRGGPEGGMLTCRPQAPARDCNERSLLRRFGAGIKVLTMTFVETYTAYREEEEQVEASYATALSLDGGVGGVAY